MDRNEMDSTVKELLKLQQQRTMLNNQKNDEIKNSKAEIEQKYSAKEKKINDQLTDNYQKLNDYYLRLEEKATFEASTIGKAIAKLISLYEGSDYAFQISTFKTKEIEHGVIDRWENDVTYDIMVVVNTDKKQDEYCKLFRDINTLQREGNMLVLQQSIYGLEKEMKFYLYETRKLHNLDGNPMKENVDFIKFEYVKDFLNIVIDYKMKNNITDISEQELYDIMSVFLLSHEAIIVANYKRRLDERKAMYEEQYYNDEKAVEKQINSIKRLNIKHN